MKKFLLATTAAVALTAGGIAVHAQSVGEAKKDQPAASQPAKRGASGEGAQEGRSRGSTDASEQKQKGQAGSQKSDSSPRGQASQDRNKESVQPSRDEQKSRAGQSAKDRDEQKSKGQAAGQRQKGEETKGQSSADQQKSKTGQTPSAQPKDGQKSTTGQSATEERKSKAGRTDGDRQNGQQKSTTGAGETKPSTDTKSRSGGSTATDTKQGTSGSSAADPKQQGTTGSQTGAQQPDRNPAAGTTGGGTTGTSGVGGSASLSQEQRTRVIQQITTTNVEPVRDVNFSVSVGATIPETVRYYDLPPSVVEIVPQYRNYRYVVVRDEIVIIDPSSRRIVATLPRSERRSTTGVGTSRIKITEEDRHVIREIVLKEQRVRPIERQLTVEIGSSIPEAIELHDFPPVVVEKVPQVKTYSFFVWKDEVVVVDPKEKRVVEVIE